MSEKVTEEKINGEFQSIIDKSRLTRVMMSKAYEKSDLIQVFLFIKNIELEQDIWKVKKNFVRLPIHCICPK